MLPPLSRISNLAALLNCLQGDGIPLRYMPGGRDSPFLFLNEAFEGSLREDPRQFIE